jgi:hypothetical protein
MQFRVLSWNLRMFLWNDQLFLNKALKLRQPHSYHLLWSTWSSDSIQVRDKIRHSSKPVAAFMVSNVMSNSIGTLTYSVIPLPPAHSGHDSFQGFKKYLAEISCASNFSSRGLQTHGMMCWIKHDIMFCGIC